MTVTKTFLHPLDEYYSYVERFWQNGCLKNTEELVLSLEEMLKSFLKLNDIIFTNNGTIPVQMTLNIFGNNGEIIAPHFSYVATA